MKNSKTALTLILFLLFLSCSKDDTNNSNENPTNGKTTAVFNPNLTYGTLTDQDGNIYKTIKIGTQTWMAENLRTTKYRNGDIIETTTPSTKDISSEISPKYQWSFDFNPGENNAATYGRMYSWYAATDSRNIAPSGWHVPTNEEWKTLHDYLGNNHGAKLKESGTIHWSSPNIDATNETGFTALPGGTRYPDGTFENLGESTEWWSSSDHWKEDNAFCWSISIDLVPDPTFYFYSMPRETIFGLYVRCIKD